MTERLMDVPALFAIRVDLPDNPLRYLSCYVLVTPERNLIIDTGFNRPECREALLEGMDELGLAPEKTDLFLTHLHSDHIGLAERFAAWGSTIYMNPVDHGYFCAIKQGSVWPDMEALFVSEGFPAEEIPLQRTGNQGRRYAPEGIFPITPVRDGDSILLGDLELRCVETPGHTPGQTLLYLPEHKILFSGDHILFGITPNISIWKGVQGSLRSYLDSLDKVGRLEIARTFPAHREREGDVYERIEALKVHHARRLDEMYAAVEARPGAAAFEIADRVK